MRSFANYDTASLRVVVDCASSKKGKKMFDINITSRLKKSGNFSIKSIKKYFHACCSKKITYF
jgi:hypothetical protein